MTITAVTAGNVIDPTTFGNAVVDKLNGIQVGNASLALDGSGRGTITYPSAFSANPTIVVSVQFSTAAQMTVHVISKTTTSFIVQVDADSVPVASESRQVNWIAVGTLA